MYDRLNIFFLHLRSKKDNIFFPFSPCWLLPNFITSIRTFITAALILICIQLNYDSNNINLTYGIISTLLIFLGFFTDLWDGASARKNNINSPRGYFYDSVIDKIFVLPAAIIVMHYFPFLASSMIYFYFFKVFLLAFIFIKLLSYSAKLHAFEIQKYYMGVNFVGYLMLMVFLIMDIKEYLAK